MSASFYDLLKYAKTGIAAPDMTAYDKMRAVAMGGGGAIKTLTGVPPLTFKANGKPLISWSMLGNGQQTGTPAPDAPIMPEFVGERTENLFDGIIGTDNTIINSSYGDTKENQNYALSDYIPVSASTSYVCSFMHNQNEPNRKTYIVSFYNIIKQPLGPAQLINMNSEGIISIPFTTLANTAYIRINWKKTYDDMFMLNLGSTILPYEPYGYKLPITNAGQTQNVYLGEVQTTRKIKKLVLDGTENFRTNGTGRFVLDDVNNYDVDTENIIVTSSHFKGQRLVPALSYISDGCVSFSSISDNKRMYIGISSYITADDFKQWLAQQYASGTPVTIWYVLAEPEMAIVNEPLCKIDTYADTLDSADAGITIPTAKGANTLTVDTDLQPSKMTITYR